MSCASSGILVHPSGSVTANLWSAIAIRPVVATLAPALGDAAADALADALGDASTEGALDVVGTGDVEADAGADAAGVPAHAAATSPTTARLRRRARALIEEVIRVKGPQSRLERGWMGSMPDGTLPALVLRVHTPMVRAARERP